MAKLFANFVSALSTSFSTSLVSSVSLTTNNKQSESDLEKKCSHCHGFLKASFEFSKTNYIVFDDCYHVRDPEGNQVRLCNCCSEMNFEFVESKPEPKRCSRCGGRTEVNLAECTISHKRCSYNDPSGNVVPVCMCTSK